MSRQASGLKRGDIETHINGIVELHFNLIKEDLETSNKLFAALKALVNADDIKSVVDQAQVDLSKDEFENYRLIASFIIDPKSSFKVLPLSDRDLVELRYAMQRHLFRCLTDLIVEKQDVIQREWLSATQKELESRFLALPTRQLLLPDYELATQHGAKLLMTVVVVTLGLKILYDVSDMGMDLWQGKFESSADNLLAGVGLAYFGIYIAFRLMPLLVTDMARIKQSLFNLKDALTEKVLPRTIFAKPPAGDQAWETALSGEIEEHRSRLMVPNA